MAKVAVLGGTGHVGKTVVEALKQHPDHSAVIFGRKSPEIVDTEVPFVEVDYADIERLAAILEDHQIDTVISCLLLDSDAVAEAQSNAISAADKSATTKRFLASNWASPSDDANPWSRFQIAAQAQLRNTSLVWTEIATGYFLDFWGQPFIKSHMPTYLPAIDIKNRVAGIPGTGNEPVSFAYSFDLAHVIAEKLLFLPDREWEPVSLIVGDVKTWNEFLALAEEARGVKFEVHYDSADDLASGKMTELPNHVEAYQFFPKPALQGLYTALGLLMATGRFNHPIEESINRRRFPDFKMLTVKEMLEQTWKSNSGVVA